MLVSVSVSVRPLIGRVFFHLFVMGRDLQSQQFTVGPACSLWAAAGTLMSFTGKVTHPISTANSVVFLAASLTRLRRDGGKLLQDLCTVSKYFLFLLQPRKSWIEESFSKRDCVKFIPSSRDLHR